MSMSNIRVKNHNVVGPLFILEVGTMPSFYSTDKLDHFFRSVGSILRRDQDVRL